MENKITKESEYAAFISYRHVAQDRQWAEWLIQALETYRVPKHLQNLGYPQRIGKVFRDEDELPLSSDLTDQIKQALAVSRNLIVICSPDTPQSKWIEREIELFKEMGKAERIHAFLIAGDPRTSFPDSLIRHQKTITKEDGTVTTIIEEREPLAANVIPITGIRKKERDKSALLKLVAAIIGCSYDDLVQRDQMREKKKQNILRAFIVSFVLLICSGGLYWWDYNRLKVSYYENMVTRWAAPEGLFPVTEKQASKRNQTYRFESRRNQVERVVLQNGLGYPRNNKDEYSYWNSGAQWHFFYDATGKVRQIDVLNRSGKRLRQEEYSQDLRSISFKNNNRDMAQSSAISTFITESSQTAKSEITRHEVEYRQDGFIIKRRFTNNYGTSKSDAMGIYGLAYELDRNGLITRENYLDQTGKGLSLNNGIAAFNYEINLLTGRANSVAYRDRHNNLILGNYGYAKFTRVYDNRGNITEEAAFGVDGKPVLHKEGYAKITRVYDDRGNITEVAYFGLDGKPVSQRDGYAKFTQVYDDRGNVTEQALFGVDGRPVLHKDGYAKITRDYDERGNEIEIAFFGIHDEPVLGNSGFAKAIREYDERGNRIAGAVYGVDGKPILAADGFATIRRVFDARGNNTEIAYFGLNNESVLHRKGYTKEINLFDGYGNITETQYVDLDGNRVTPSSE